jgi:hypothetical protein
VAVVVVVAAVGVVVRLVAGGDAAATLEVGMEAATLRVDAFAVGEDAGTAEDVDKGGGGRGGGCAGTRPRARA